MLDWVVDKIWVAVSYVPALIVAEESPNFALIRAMFGLSLIVLLAYLIGMRPFRSAIARGLRTVSGLIVRKR